LGEKIYLFIINVEEALHQQLILTHSKNHFKK